MRARLWVLAVAGVVAAGSAYAQSGADVAKAKGCVGCHDMDTKKVGPAFKDVAAKYKGDKGAESKIVTMLKEGKGHPMKIAASDAEFKAVAQYVLQGK